MADSRAEHRLPVTQLLIIDGHAYAYRSFFAIRNLHAPDGTATNAIFGFIKMLERARTLLNPVCVVVLWDGGLDAGRVESLPAYKAQRPAMPEDLETQLDEIQHYLQAAGICSRCQEGLEADDAIAALTQKASAAKWDTVIASSDKDFMQLVSPRVRLLNPGDKQQPLWDAAKVVEKTGVPPGQIVDWLSLVGDSVDNIDGVRGVGPKTAARLLTEFESLEGLYERLEEIQPEKLRTAVEQSRDRVFRNRSLVRLKAELPGTPALEDCALRGENRARLGQLFAGWGFRSLAARYADEAETQALLL